MHHRVLHFLSLLVIGLVFAVSVPAAETHGCTRAYRQAAELLNQGKAKQAVESGRRMITKCPGFYPAYMMLGVAYQQLKDFGKAEEYLREAVKLAPQSAVPHLNLGSYYLSLGRALQASTEFKKAVALDPGGAVGWFDLGLSELKGGDADIALAHLKRASRLDPDNRRIRLALISAALRTGQPELARQQADQLIALGPQDPSLLLVLGALLDAGGDAAKARQVYEYARKASSNPLTLFLEAANRASAEGKYRSALSLLEFISDAGKSSAGWNELIGGAYYRLGQIKPAVDHLQAAIKLDPHNEDYYLELGTLLTQYHANDVCLALFQSAAKILPNSVKIRSALAVAYMMEKRYSQAEESFQNIILASPDYFPAYQLLGETYQASQQWEKLETVGQKITTRYPREAVGWYYRSQAEYELAMRANREFSAAESDVRKSLAVDSHYGPAYYLLGKILSAEDRGEDAVIALKRAASLDDDPTVLYTLALTYRKLGEANKSAVALKQFNEAVERKKASYQKLILTIDESRVQSAN